MTEEGKTPVTFTQTVKVPGYSSSFSRGETVELPAELARSLSERGYCRPTEDQVEDTSAEPDREITDLGGGWYETPGGEKVQGYEKAVERTKNE